MPKNIRPVETIPGGVASFERDALESIGGEYGVDPVAILAAARGEAERKVREAYAEGFRRGQTAGEEAFRATVAECEGLLRAAGQTLVEARTNYLDATRDEVANLAFAVASRILRREVSLDRELVTTMARTALERLANEERITLRVNPADLEALRLNQVVLLETVEGIETFEIVSDETISPGGCIAETRELVVDAQLKAQLAEIIDQLTKP